MTVTCSVSTASSSIEPSIKQYSLRTVLAVWATAALPMAALAWLVAPALAGPAPSARRPAPGAQRPALHPGAHRGAVRRPSVAVPTGRDARR